ncbi:MAG: mitochondrial fission ELM1 family protein, partial [Candidatus Omnitrophica bacterium]|nr:mitochondrial fission ELM1 family protein [Candidatus Omnitrophota bacterium]
SMTKMDTSYIDKYVRVRNMERIEKAAKNPGGMILVSAHFGNWELSTMTSAVKGFPLYVLTRDQKMKRLSELLNLLRESKGNTVIRKGSDVKKIFKVLRAGKSIGLLADQNAGISGRLVDFFGRPASAVTGPYRFAQKSGAWILPAFIHRTRGPYHELVVEEPMVIGKNEDIMPYVRRYSRLLEKRIRDFPTQWFWMHKRWKATPLKKIMILDDGKKGHLKQSLAVAKQIRRFRSDEGFSEEHTRIEIVRIRYRNRMARAFLNAVNPFMTYRRQCHLKCLRLALDAESYKNAVNRYADVIVSCGSSLFRVNRILKMENASRNITVLDPGRLDRGRFDLIVMPRHDVTRGLSRCENIIVTDMVPNLIDPGELSLLKSKAAGKGPQEGGMRIGLLIGGDNAHFAFNDSLVSALAAAVRTACEKTDNRLYVTTSRRTPRAAEAVIRTAFESAPFCGMFVSGKTDTDERTVEKILAISDIVIVSGESMSMVSEAVSSGKPVLVFMPRKKSSRPTKYEKFAKRLQGKGSIRLIKPEDIPGEIDSAGREVKRPVLPDDDRRIYEKMYRLF